MTALWNATKYTALPKFSNVLTWGMMKLSWPSICYSIRQSSSTRRNWTDKTLKKAIGNSILLTRFRSSYLWGYRLAVANDFLQNN